MNNYVITFADVQDDNSKFVIKLRSKLEEISDGKFLQVFPLQMVIRTKLSIKEVAKEIESEGKQTRISIFKFDEWASSESRTQNLMNGLL